MKISEHLIHELLDLTRQFANIPYNSIFTFVAYDSKKTLDFWDNNIYYPMTRGRNDYGYKIESLLVEIRTELARSEYREND